MVLVGRTSRSLACLDELEGRRVVVEIKAKLPRGCLAVPIGLCSCLSGDRRVDYRGICLATRIR